MAAGLGDSAAWPLVVDEAFEPPDVFALLPEPGMRPVLLRNWGRSSKRFFWQAAACALALACVAVPCVLAASRARVPQTSSITNASRLWWWPWSAGSSSEDTSSTTTTTAIRQSLTPSLTPVPVSVEVTTTEATGEQAERAEPWKAEFSEVDGGIHRACIGAEGDWVNYFDLHMDETLHGCKKLCENNDACTGIAHYKEGRCEVWTRAISGSKDAHGATCLRFDPRGFGPVGGGVDHSCDMGEDFSVALANSTEVPSMYECKVLCLRSAVCAGIEFAESGKCKVWKKAVHKSSPSSGSTCLRYLLPGFKHADPDTSRSICALADTDDDASKFRHVHHKVASLYACKVECARAKFCGGIEYHHTGRCDVWVRPINATKRTPHKKMCLRYVPVGKYASLFCVSLAVPWTNEPDLLGMQLREGKSIFACNEFAVYSNPVFKLGQMETKKIDIDLHCKKGGEYHTMLNTPIFMKLWDEILKAGRFKLHDWTLKVDPDAVFFPSRLRYIARHLAHLTLDAPNGAFLNNCQLGMHGPIEVLTTRALEAYEEGASQCWQAPQEDVYLENCMEKVHVLRVNQFDTVAEEECWRGTWHQYPEWADCETAHAGFHPFKDVENYTQCWDRAMEANAWPPRKLHEVV